MITQNPHVSNTISYRRVIGLANLRNVNSTAEEKKSQEEAQSPPSSQSEQDSTKKLTEEINKLNTEITQLKEKNNEFLVSFNLRQTFAKLNSSFSRTSTKEH